jgi:hypothetical protein
VLFAKTVNSWQVITPDDERLGPKHIVKGYEITKEK